MIFRFPTSPGTTATGSPSHSTSRQSSEASSAGRTAWARRSRVRWRRPEASGPRPARRRGRVSTTIPPSTRLMVSTQGMAAVAAPWRRAAAMTASMSAGRPGGGRRRGRRRSRRRRPRRGRPPPSRAGARPPGTQRTPVRPSRGPGARTSSWRASGQTTTTDESTDRGHRPATRSRTCRRRSQRATRPRPAPTLSIAGALAERPAAGTMTATLSGPPPGSGAAPSGAALPPPAAGRSRWRRRSSVRRRSAAPR